MNAAQEYLSRDSKILRVDLPCSFMATGVEGKYVIAFHPVDRPEMMCRKVWSIDKGNANDILPPCQTSIIPIRLLNAPWRAMPKNIHPISYWYDLPVRNKNNPIISQLDYDNIGQDFLFSQTHKKFRDSWIWTSFQNTFIEDMAFRGLSSNYFSPARTELIPYNAKMYRYWSIWKQHMLDFPEEIAPELFYQIASRKHSMKNSQQYLAPLN